MRLFIVLLCVVTFCLPVRGEKMPQQQSVFDQARRAYETGKYARALDLLAKTIEQSPDGTQKNRAYYYMGLVLFELGLYYSSYTAFRNILLTADDNNKEMYEKAIKNCVIIADKLNMVERVGKALAGLPQGFIAASVGGLSHYALGVYYFTVQDFKKAAAHLKSVDPSNQFYPKAMFYLGILAVKGKDYKEGNFYFEKIIEITKQKKDFQNVNELARLNLARSLYSMGDIDRSVETYSQFLSTSPYWLTVLHEASWPLMRVNDTTVSLGNLHTVLSPFYREELVGEAYVLRATILFSLCKYEEMRQTLTQFFNIYDPVLRAMSSEVNQLGSPESFFRAFVTQKGMHRGFVNYARRDEGIRSEMRVLQLLRDERKNIAKYTRNEQMRRMGQILDDAEKALSVEIGVVLQKLHKRKLNELQEQREQANYLKVEIVTGEKELIEGQKGLPPRRVVDVETSVAAGFHFWPFRGEYWEDELGTFVYTTESACVN